jgi:2-octaprenylphenol hydroxylase
MKQQFEILIVGAGMIGLTVATLLAGSAHRSRFSVTVLDSATAPTYDVDGEVGLRVSAVSLGSANILRTVGAWESIESARISPYQSMRVWDACAGVEGSETLCFDAADFAVPELGFIVENALIRQALLDQAAQNDVNIRFETGIDRLDVGGSRKTVVLQDGTSLTPDLLIAADGAGSPVRRSAGIPARAWQYPQSALVTHMRPALDHRQTAWQRFLANGPLALLPLADGRVSIVWSTTPDEVSNALAATDDALGEMLTEASDGVLGALQTAGPRGSFSLRAQHAVRYVEQGLALVGDAAHSVHPLAGQGANLGFADAQALVDALCQALERDEYPGDLPTLRAYERERRAANGTMLRFVDSINRLFLEQSSGYAGLRRRGMRLFNRSGPIRRRAVQVALGINV